VRLPPILLALEACPSVLQYVLIFARIRNTLWQIDNRRIHKVELLHRPGDRNGSKYPAQFSHTLAGNGCAGLRLLPQYRRRFDAAVDRIEHVG
jgi:hypothetical protein